MQPEWTRQAWNFDPFPDRWYQIKALWGADEIIWFVQPGGDLGETLLQSTTFSWGEKEGQTLFSSLWWPVTGAKENWDRVPREQATKPVKFKKYLHITPWYKVEFLRFPEVGKELNSMTMMSPFQLSLFCNSMKLVIQYDCFSETCWRNILF